MSHEPASISLHVFAFAVALVGACLSGRSGRIIWVNMGVCCDASGSQYMYWVVPHTDHVTTKNFAGKNRVWLRRHRLDRITGIHDRPREDWDTRFSTWGGESRTCFSDVTFDTSASGCRTSFVVRQAMSVAMLGKGFKVVSASAFSK